MIQEGEDDIANLLKDNFMIQNERGSAALTEV